jgi:iron(III) transport system ATP-binding protein
VFVPAERRSIGMVFQSYAIWPHMTVYQNVAFPLRVGNNRVGPSEVKRRVDEALDLVALGEYRDRMSSALSGGQQQRLALARAIVRRPRLLLLDEPLSNLDARLRDRMRDELRALQAELGVTTIYVTHDQGEALSMSSYIAVMDAGRIVQEGRPFDVYTQPATRFVAEFLGNSNVFPASVIDRSPERVVLETRFGTLHAAAGANAATKSNVVVSVRPENVAVSVAPAGNGNVVKGCLRSVVFLGEFAESLIECNGTLIRSHQRTGAPFRPGDEVHVHIAEADCVVIC